MKAIILIAPILALVACATPELSQQEVAFIEAQMQVNTLSIDCPEGCRVEYRDPRDQVQIPRATNGWDAMIAVGQSTERLVSGAVPIVGVGYLGTEAIKALRGSGAVTSTNTTTTQNDTNTTDARTYTDIDRSVGDNSGTNSGNDGQIMPGNSGRIDSDDDYTSTPTVVEQPAPVSPSDD